MVVHKSLTKALIDAKRLELGGGDPVLIEKTILAFALLSLLVLRKVPLVFKGGTSLLLRLPQPHRLSIDVDILCPLSAADLDPILHEVASTPPFLRYQEDPRPSKRLPVRRHFKFFYQPVDSRNPAPFVVLDVVQSEPQHPHASQVRLESPLLLVENDLSVTVPTIEGLLAEKLTAFAPNTIGVPCQENTAMQVMKQLFDVAILFDAAHDFVTVGTAYDAVFVLENHYRGGCFSRSDTLLDSMDTARRICHHRLKGAVVHPHQDLLDQGRRALGSHLLGGVFTESQVKTAAAKVACLAAALLHNRLHTFTGVFRYDIRLINQWSGVVLSDPVLQRLKGGNPEAFFYWWLAEKLSMPSA